MQIIILFPLHSRFFRSIFASILWLHFIGQNKKVENYKEQTTGRGSDFGFSMDSKGVGVSGKSWDGSWPDGTVTCLWFLHTVSLKFPFIVLKK